MIVKRESEFRRNNYSYLREHVDHTPVAVVLAKTGDPFLKSIQKLDKKHKLLFAVDTYMQVDLVSIHT